MNQIANDIPSTCYIQAIPRSRKEDQAIVSEFITNLQVISTKPFLSKKRSDRIHDLANTLILKQADADFDPHRFFVFLYTTKASKVINEVLNFDSQSQQFKPRKLMTLTNKSVQFIANHSQLIKLKKAYTQLMIFRHGSQGTYTDDEQTVLESIDIFDLSIKNDQVEQLETITDECQKLFTYLNTPSEQRVLPPIDIDGIEKITGDILRVL